MSRHIMLCDLEEECHMHLRMRTFMRARRRRPDRAALAAGEMGNAGSEKHRLEEMQRAEKREREKRGDGWKPRWFDAVESPELMPGGCLGCVICRCFACEFVMVA